MHVRRARVEDVEEACQVLRRSITELCHADHQGDAATLALWLANKTADNMRRWIAQHHVFVATEGNTILGVGAIGSSGEIMLNYVSPDARFRGISKAILPRLERAACEFACGTTTLLSSATARRFYLAAGYAETEPPTLGFGVTVGYPMAKRLSNPGYVADRSHRSVAVCGYPGEAGCQREEVVVKTCAMVVALVLSVGSSASSVAAAPITPMPAAAGIGGLVAPASHRCVPSRCGCRGNQTTWCTRDCRRDRHCRCRQSKYVCRYFRG